VNPEEALDRARRASFGEDLSGFVVEPTDRVTPEKLMDWAVIETDPALVRSTRWWGAPITWLKRAARHLLRQELGQAYAQQSRFNLMVVTKLTELEDRDPRPPGP
jgi:ABC-type antimicrobial peptide transport system ATPase subunit